MKINKIIWEQKLIISVLIMLLCPSSFFAQKPVPDTKSPKLIIGIVVDQMRADYLERFKDKFSEGGFKRLMQQGLVCTNTNINYFQTVTAPGHAAIYTGTTPSINGIVENDWFDRRLGWTRYCVGDSTVKSVGTYSAAGMMSPRNLFSTTITDQLRLAFNFKSRVVGISLKDRGAILPAGHSGKAFWLDYSNGKFITSSYYSDALPSWINDFNSRYLVQSYMCQKWNTLLPIEQYTESSADDVPYEAPLHMAEARPVFPHDLNTYNRMDFDIISRTPFGNSLLKELALAAMTGDSLGKGNVPDFLTISFSSTDYIGHWFGINSIELEDTYLRLDRDIAELLAFLDNNYGKDNVLVFLTADHGAANNTLYSHDHNLPGALFDGKSVIDSLSLFLNRTYGKGGFILDYINQSVYLDRAVISEKHLSVEEVEKSCVSFLSPLKGVANVTTSVSLESCDSPFGYDKMIQRGYNKKRSGDVILTLMPGWMEWKATGTTHGSPYSYDTHVPLIFYGWHVKSGVHDAPVSITDIAPTISNLLHIQAPSGCTGTAIPVE